LEVTLVPALLRLFVPLVALALLTFVPAATGKHTADDHSANMVHVFNSKNVAPQPTGGAINSDLGFWENLAVAGNYRGFRIFDITKPARPVLLTSFPCNGGQGDVSIYQAKERLLLIQSVDAPQDRRECNSRNITTELLPGELDWEGLRIFDITKPTAPLLIATVATDCGSHTHTTIPDDENQRAIVYVSSYPLAPAIGDECQIPHSKIAVVVIPDANPSAARVHHYQPIHAQPVPAGGGGGDHGLPGAIGCHDITAFTDPKVEAAAAACLTEGQLWDISDPLFPCTIAETCHTHIDNAVVEIWHSSAFTWDAEVVLFGDEHGGGSGPGCTGADTEGNIWFYKNVPPGTPTAPLFGRYALPRPQVPEECTLHNFSIIPINDNEAYIGVSSAYRGGTSVFEFSNLKPTNGPVPVLDPFTAPIVAREIGWYDSKNGDLRGNDDAWSSYWYNDFIYVNGGLNRAPDASQDRGFDIYKLLNDNGKQFTARSFHHFNPQTQENFETLGG
jgi:hypothetical protein